MQTKTIGLCQPVKDNTVVHSGSIIQPDRVMHTSYYGNAKPRCYRCNQTIIERIPQTPTAKVIVTFMVCWMENVCFQCLKEEDLSRCKDKEFLESYDVMYDTNYLGKIAL